MRLLIIGLLFFTCSYIRAQDSTETTEVDHQLWLDYNLNKRVTDRFGYGGDVGMRGFVSNYDWNQIYIRPRITYEIAQFAQFAGGIAYFFTDFLEDVNVNEFRGFQDLVLEGPDFNFVVFRFRLRFEERYFYYSSIPDDWYIRARYLIMMETKDFRIKNQNFYLSGMYEGFQPIVNTSSYEIFIDRTRIKAILGHRVSPNFRYEIHYMWQNTRNYSDTGFETANNIIRLRFFHRIPYKDKQKD